METNIQTLNKYEGKDNQRLRIIADAIIIFSLIGRLENVSLQTTGFKIDTEKYSYSLFDLADNFGDGLLLKENSKGNLSEDLLDAFFNHNDELDIKNFSGQNSELILAEKIYLEWKEILLTAIKNERNESKD